MASEINTNTNCSKPKSMDSADTNTILADDSSAKEKKDNNYVGLNVSGMIYATSKTTLTRYPNTFFDGLLDCGVVTPAKDDKGNFLINRDGKIFRHVLNFLRCGELLLSEKNILVNFNLLEQEADFFMLDEMKKALCAVKEKIEEDGRYTRHECDKLSTTVGLNVGGVVYKTSLFSLRRFSDTFFCRLLDGFVPSAMDEEGNYLIDRDGTIFEHVLDFMKHGELILPESFDELALLKSEADFYMLSALKDALEDRVDLVGFIINHQIFKLNRKDVLRNKDSLLCSIMTGRESCCRDFQGNYIIDESILSVRVLMIYISEGGLITSGSILGECRETLSEDAGILGLKELDDHLQSLDFMEEHCRERPVYIHVYHWDDSCSPCCIAYSNQDTDFFTRRRSNIDIYRSFFYSLQRLTLGVAEIAIGYVDQYKLNKDGRASVDDVVAYFSSRPIGGTPAIVNVVPPKHQSVCTLIEFTVND